jgi:hypothetical protein
LAYKPLLLLKKLRLKNYEVCVTSIEPLGKMVCAGTEYEGLAAVYAIGLLKDPRGIPYLQLAMKDGWPRIKELATAVITDLNDLLTQDSVPLTQGRR